jgi:hypothetical protein
LERPTGITVIAWLSIIGGALTLLAGCSTLALFALGGASSVDDPTGGLMAGTTLGICAFAICAILAVISFLEGWGLLGLKSWARTLLLVLAIIGLLGFPIGTIINAIILWYIFQPEVKTAFGVV